MRFKELLPDYNRISAYKGALRFHEPEDLSWRQSWGEHYGHLRPEIKIFSSDAFGTVYGLLGNESVCIFWPETGELENINSSIEEFFQFILDDPVNTIHYDLYVQAVKKYGPPSINQHFAFIIETVLGGALATENLVVMDAVNHYKALAKIALQIHNLPIGQKVDVTRES